MMRATFLFTLVLLVFLTASPLSFGLSYDPPESWRDEGGGSGGHRFERRNAVVIAVERVGPAVANISTERVVSVASNDPVYGQRDELFGNFFENYFGGYEKKKVETPLGSGVIIDPEGYIVTNEHVISVASKIIITLSDGSTHDAKLVSSDHENDLAVLKMESPEPFPYVEMGKSEDLMIGETVIALGNPLGFKNSVTTGVLSATGRDLSFQGRYGAVKYEGLVQTDALINPGNSGGPLVNINGELIGINVALVSAAQGIGFAIPVDKVKETLIKLFDFQRINRVWLGAQFEVLLKDREGISIKTIEQGSPADDAGLREGDIVLEVDGRDVDDVLEFEKYLMNKEAGDRLNVTVESNSGRRRDISITLGNVPVPSGEELSWDKLGIGVQELTPGIAEHLGLWWVDGGVLITDVDKTGPTAEMGLQPDYVIIRMGEYKITNLEQLALLLERVEPGQTVYIGLAWADRGGAHQGYIQIKTR
ncbi:MAG: trypsin-like peptidase domain-containing protein [Candidatus Brocadiales bacterium]